MQQKINIHETAFVTAAFRAGDQSLSKDPYAHLWANELTNLHAESYSNAVSSYEAVAHCLRNRYFYDSLSMLIKREQIDLLMNFGCGFSMYPFLLDSSLLYLEIDTNDVVSYKEEKTKFWQQEGVLPERDIRYIPADFNAPSLEELYEKLLPLCKGRRSFILIEGVLFFLAREDTKRLFELFNRLQYKGEYIGSVSFRPSLEDKPVFRKLVDFVEANLEKNQQFTYQTIPDSYYNKIEGYKLIDHQDTLMLSSHYIPDTTLPSAKVLNEHMYLLQKF